MPNRTPTSEGGGGSVIDQVVAFFRSKGLPDYQIAGILGNIRVESGFNTGAHNPGEGAVGFVQWEGGRDDAMRSWTASKGLDPGSVEGQLQYIWHELHTSESAAFHAFRATTNAADAAAVWDAQYERSAGTTRQDRINSATAFMSSGLKSDGGSAGGVGTVSSAGNASPSAAGQQQDRSTYNTYAGVDSLGKLLRKIPELKNVLQDAIAGNWSISKFENAVEDSDWWKNHSATARSALIQQANDPASWKQTLTGTTNDVRSLATKLGFGVDAATAEAIATNAILTGNTNNQEWLTRQLGRRQDYSDITSGDGLKGQMAQNYAALQQLTSAYGFNYDEGTLGRAAQNITMGKTDINAWQQHLIQLAKGKYPGIAEQLDAGQTVADIAAPYMQTYAQLLEVNPQSVDITKTPLIQRALQGQATGKSTIPAVMSLYDFEQQVRQDKRWQYTKNAHDTYANVLTTLGDAFGFGGF